MAKRVFKQVTKTYLDTTTNAVGLLYDQANTLQEVPSFLTSSEEMSWLEEKFNMDFEMIDMGEGYIIYQCTQQPEYCIVIIAL